MFPSIALALSLVTAQVDPEAPLLRRPGFRPVPPVGVAPAAPNPAPEPDDEALLGGVDLPTDPASLMAFLRRQKISEADRRHIDALIRQLGVDEFELRQSATEELIRIGPSAVAALKEALKTKDLEVLRRAESCLKAIESVAGPAYQEAVIRLLAKKAPEPAVGLLLEVVTELHGTAIIDTVAQSLARAGVPAGRPVPAVVQALADRASVRREVAGEAIARAGDAEARKVVRALLNDPEPLVRMRVATALLERGEPEALPVMIRLLQEAPEDRAYEIESSLLAVAREQAPETSVGKTHESRKLAADAWRIWYEKTGKKLDLAKVMEEANKPGPLLFLGTTVGAPIKSKILEADATGKALWDFEIAGTVLSVQKLPRDRVLVAEYSNRKVTERTPKGDVVWSKDLSNLPIEAVRLPGGNTLIGMRNSIVEVDGEGKELRTILRNDLVCGMTTLRNAEIGIVTSNSRFVRLDAEGKELSSFAMNGRMYTIGGHFAVSPNGARITIPLFYPAVGAAGVNQGRVVEYDNSGKVIWEVEVDRPTCVRRLPSGNVLVSSRFHTTILELDSRGKQVNKYEIPGGNRGALDVRR
jgi:hypothetical protein